MSGIGSSLKTNKKVKTQHLKEILNLSVFLNIQHIVIVS